MKKKIIILCMALALCHIPAWAGQMFYGSVIAQHTFEGWELFYDYGNSKTCEEDSHSGNRSRKFDASQPGSINLHTNPIEVEPGKCYYAQVWVKGNGNRILYDKKAIWVTGASYLNQKFLTPVYTDEYGWTKYGAYFKAVEGQSEARVVLYYDSTQNPYGSTFYFDDIYVYAAPSRLSMDHIVTDGAVSLNKVNVYGYDDTGNKEKIAIGTAFEWEIVSGDGSIDSYGNLVCRSEEGGTVRVRAQAFGLSCEANVVFKGGLSSELSRNTVRITNNKNEASDVWVFFVLYDQNERLYDISSTKSVVSAHGAKDVPVPQLHIPKQLRKQKKKIIVAAQDYFQVYDVADE